MAGVNKAFLLVTVVTPRRSKSTIDIRQRTGLAGPDVGPEVRTG